MAEKNITNAVLGVDIKESYFLAKSDADREKIISTLNKNVMENIEFLSIDNEKVKTFKNVVIGDTIYDVKIGEVPVTKILKYSVKIAQQIDPNTLSRAVDYEIFSDGEIAYSYSENMGDMIKLATQEAVAEVISKCVDREKINQCENEIVSKLKLLSEDRQISVYNININNNNSKASISIHAAPIEDKIYSYYIKTGDRCSYRFVKDEVGYQVFEGAALYANKGPCGPIKIDDYKKIVEVLNKCLKVQKTSGAEKSF